MPRNQQPEPEVDVFYKKTIGLPYGDRELRFRVSQDLFSSHEIDEGTRLLLRSLGRLEIPAGAKILDLGCGYGPLGIALASVDPARDVHLVDRDELAVEYARQNAAINGIANAQAYGSLGYDDVADRDFDLIVSNIPAKAGDRVIEHLLRTAGHRLSPNGAAAIVVIEPIAEMVRAMLEAAPEIEVTFTRATAAYSVFHYRFVSPPEVALDAGFASGTYAAGSATFDVAGQTMAIETAAGLDEGDGPSAATQMLVDAMAAHTTAPGVETALILNPTQGYVPATVARTHPSPRIVLVDRDLLALRQSRANLVRLGVDASAIEILHVSTLPAEVDGIELVAGVVREDEGPDAANETADRASTLLAHGGMILLAASSTGITRVERHVMAHPALRVSERKRHRGASVLIIERRPLRSER